MKKTGPSIELRIEQLSAGGAGVARTGAGEVVFVSGTAPGDLVEVEVDRGARPARGALLRVIEPGPGRVSPPCEFVGACGGCDWMHLSPEAQEQAHAEILRGAIVRATSITDLPPIRVHHAPQPLGYRTRARLYARTSRAGAAVGYRAEGSHALAPVDRCLVLSPALDPLLRELPEILAGARGEGDLLIALGEGGRPVVEIGWRGELAQATWQKLDERVAAGAWAGARVVLPGASRPASFGDPRPVIHGADGAPLTLAAGGFGQPSEEGASTLARRAAELAWIDAPARPLRVLELFAGSGTLSVLLARGPSGGAAPASFVAVEHGAEAAACLRENLAARGLAGKVVVADADATPIASPTPGGFARTSRATPPSPRTDVVILDPPRGGAPGAVAAIAASRATRSVVYVSCSPPTLARDLATLTAAGLRITHVEAVELFPQTSHVEALVRLARQALPR